MLFDQAPKRRYRLTVANQDELFECEPLDCRLSYRTCASRSVRGNALRRGENGAWVPEQWALYASSCRGCPVGEAHARKLGAVCGDRPGPYKPPGPTAYGGVRGGHRLPGKPMRMCLACNKPHTGPGRYGKCCRKKMRKKLLARS